MEDLIREIVDRNWRISFQLLHPQMPEDNPRVLCSITTQDLPAARCPDKSRLMQQCSIHDADDLGALESELKKSLAELIREYNALPRVDAYGKALAEDER